MAMSTKETVLGEGFEREIRLIGPAAFDRLQHSRVAVFGIGGVGGFACEALARSGIGAIDIIDSDTLDETNINRQIIALGSTIGRSKVQVMAERIREINPKCSIRAVQLFFDHRTAAGFCFADYDYVIDAVDTVAAKELIIRMAQDAGTPVISSMGTGNKLDPTGFKVTDISRTKICPLARVMRKRLRKAGIDHLKVVWSEEEPIPVQGDSPASIAFVPPVAGMILAGEVVKDIIEKEA